MPKPAPASKRAFTSKPKAAPAKQSPSKPAKRAATSELPFGGFGPPDWGNRPAAPLAFAKTGDAAVDAAVAAFVAKPQWPALKKIHKVATPAHARVLLAGPMLDLGDAYEASAAELAALDTKARRNRYKVLLDVSQQGTRGHLFAWLVNQLVDTPEGRAHLVALATARNTPRSGRRGIVLWLVRREDGTVSDLVALGRALRPLGWIGDPTQEDAAFSTCVMLSLLEDPKAALAWVAPLLTPGDPRGIVGSVLDGIEGAFSENPNDSAARQELSARLDRKALKPLVAPIRALVGKPDVGERAKTVLALLS